MREAFEHQRMTVLGRPSRFADRRGVALAMSLVVAIVLASLGASLLMRSLNEDLIGQRSAARQEAFYLAEAGVDRASINLRTPTDTSDDIPPDATTHVVLPSGYFTLETPQLIGVNTWKVTSHGYSGSEHRRIETIYLLTPQSIFQYAVFGDQGVRMNGNIHTDSYDSRLGPYNTNSQNGPINHGQHGDVGTNSTQGANANETPAVDLIGNSYQIEGKILVGPGVADPTQVVDGENASHITGDPMVVSASATFPMPPVTVPAALQSSCADLSLSGNGASVSLPPTGGPLHNGTYCYHNVSLKGGATLTSSGPVTIYVTGTLTATGNSTTIGSSGAPKHMLFLMKPDSQALLQNDEEGSLGGHTRFYGGIYGPQADIDVFGNAEVFGSIVAHSVQVQGSAQVHYDEGLAELTTIQNIYQRQVISWQELN